MVAVLVVVRLPFPRHCKSTAAPLCSKHQPVAGFTMSADSASVGHALASQARKLSGYWSGPVNRKTGGGMDDPGKALLQSAGVSHTLFRQTEDRNR
jgi:hypothetical protein